jgi:uncharacterized membrane protein
MATTGRPDEVVEPAESQDSPSVRTGVAMVLLGLLGLLGSAALTVERILVASDPDHVPSCTFNPVLTCTTAMLSDEGSLFGIPNPLLGVAGFPVVMATGAALLAGARLRPWYWLGMWLGTVAGVVFVHFLVYVSLARVNALCPYCMVVWVATIPLFAVVSAYAIPRGALGARAASSTVVQDLLALRWWLVGLWFTVLVALAGIVFWDYWSTLV